MTVALDHSRSRRLGDTDKAEQDPSKIPAMPQTGVHSLRHNQNSLANIDIADQLVATR
jgi:hypothetical protein